MEKDIGVADVHQPTALGNEKPPKRRKVRSFNEALATYLEDETDQVAAEKMWGDEEDEEDVRKMWTDAAREAAAEARAKGTFVRHGYGADKKAALAHMKAARAAGFDAKVFRVSQHIGGTSTGGYASHIRNESYTANDYHVHVGANIQPPGTGAGIPFHQMGKAQSFNAAVLALRDGTDNTAKTEKRLSLDVQKVDADKQEIFGWASVCTLDGERVIDKQNDIIPVDEIEKGAYEFVQFSRDMGDMHNRLGTGRMIESMVFTKEKAAHGVVAKDADGKSIEGWWVGFHVVDPHTWTAMKAGDRPELSIGGRASWEEA